MDNCGGTVPSCPPSPRLIRLWLYIFFYLIDTFCRWKKRKSCTGPIRGRSRRTCEVHLPIFATPLRYRLATCRNRKIKELPVHGENPGTCWCEVYQTHTANTKERVARDLSVEGFQELVKCIFPSLPSPQKYRLATCRSRRIEELPVHIRDMARVLEHVGARYTGRILLIPKKELHGTYPWKVSKNLWSASSHLCHLPKSTD